MGRTPTHGMSYTKTYKSWQGMRQRCYNPHNRDYWRYGGRGIRVCKRWLKSFKAFFADMGVRPDNCTLDRLDNNRGYKPSNCRWATKAEQGRNRGHVKLDNDKVRNIRLRYAEGNVTQESLAGEFGIAQSAVSKIVTNERWAEIGG